MAIYTQVIMKCLCQNMKSINRPTIIALIITLFATETSRQSIESTHNLGNNTEDSHTGYYISDSKLSEVKNHLSNYIRYSGMSKSDVDEFLYDLCDTIHPCLYNVFFRYDTPVEGFNVEGYFGIAPDGSTDYQSYNTVTAHLFFSSDSTIFDVYHPTFSPFIDGFPDTIKALDCITLSYETPQFPNLNHIPLDSIRNLPFAFIDIDFDGKKELLLANPGNGQKTICTYSAYSIPNLKELEPFKGYIWHCLDEWTEFNYEKHTIISSLWGGYDGCEKWYFKYDGNILKPYLKEEYTQWFDVLKSSTPIEHQK